MSKKISVLEFLKKELPDLIIKAGSEDVNKKYFAESQDYKMGFLQGYLEGAGIVQRLVIGILDEDSEIMKLFLQEPK